MISLLLVATVSGAVVGLVENARAGKPLQVLPSTAAELELDTYHVGENVLAGARYLRQLLDRFKSTDLAFAAYNAGWLRSSATEGGRTTKQSPTSRT